jgi:hypothetical protein
MLNRIVFGLALAFAALTGVAVGQETHPCALITPEEAAAALGAPLAVPPFAYDGAGPNPEGGLCRLEDEDFRSIDLRVVWRDGGEEFAAMNIVGGVISDSDLRDLLEISEGATEIGEWDEARIFGCCEFVALRGETLVGIAFGDATGGFAGAVELANAALRRLESQLAFDPAASIAAATDREAQRPAVRNACELVAAAKVEEIIGTTPSGAVGDEAGCTWSWEVPGEGYVTEMTMRVTWRGGFAEQRMILDAIGMAGSMLRSEGLSVDADDGEAARFADATSSTFIAEMAVENDVLLAIESGGFMADIAQGFIRAAVETMRAP